MELGIGSYGLGLLAGVLSTLSPCVLPLLPILIGSATAAHPRAPLALAAGLALSYAVIGTVVASAGSLLGLDAGLLRQVGAIMLAIFGGILLSASLQQRFATATGGLGNAGQTLLQRLSPEGWPGQFVVGLVLGVVWSPCVGPTLGAAIVLAGQGQQLAQAALLMGLFGLGAALPVLVLAQVSRSAWNRSRSRWMGAGKAGKMLLGAVMVAIAVIILTGWDKSVEAWVLDHSPAWLAELTTRF